MKKRKKAIVKAQGRRAAVRRRRRRATAPAVHPAGSSAAQEGWRLSSPPASTWGSCQRWGPPGSPPQHPPLLHPALWGCLASHCSASWPNWSCANAAVTWPWKVSGPLCPLPIAVPPPHCCAPRCPPGMLCAVHATQRSCSGGAAACVQGCAGQSACCAAGEGLCARSQRAFIVQGHVHAVLAVQGFVCLHSTALHAGAVHALSAAPCTYLQSRTVCVFPPQSLCVRDLYVCSTGHCACFHRTFAVQGFLHACTEHLQLRALCVFEPCLCCAGLHVPFAHGVQQQQHGARQQGPAHSPGPSSGLCSSAGSRQAPGFPPSSASPGNPGGPCREGPGTSPAPLQWAGGRRAVRARCWLCFAIGLWVCVGAVESPWSRLPQMGLWLGCITASLPTLALALCTDEFIAGRCHAPISAAHWGHTVPFVPSPCSVDALWQRVHAAPRSPQTPACPQIPKPPRSAPRAHPWVLTPPVGSMPLQCSMRWDGTGGPGASPLTSALGRGGRGPAGLQPTEPCHGGSCLVSGGGSQPGGQPPGAQPPAHLPPAPCPRAAPQVHLDPQNQGGE